MIESNFDAKVCQADQWDDAAAQLRSQSFDLVLVNRKLDIDYSDGLEVIRRIKQDPLLKSLPVMLVTNFAEYQQQAVQAGAVEGFGKQSLRRRTLCRSSNRFWACPGIDEPRSHFIPAA